MQFFYYLSVTLLVTKSVTFLHSEISTSLMWNNFCQNREIENFVFCEIKYAFNICEANISQQSYFTWRSQISHAAGVFRWKKTIPKNSLFFGDPYGIRTHVIAVKGRCLNHLTKGPHFGSPSRTWTYDNSVNSRVLYRLSYWGIFLCGTFVPHFTLATSYFPGTLPSEYHRHYGA